MIGVQSNIITGPYIIGSSTAESTVKINDASYSVGPGNWNISLSGINVTSLSEAFANQRKITNLRLRFDVAEGTSAYLMLQNCTALTKLDLGDINGEKLSSVHGMFTSCTSLTSLNLSSWKINSRTTRFSFLFSHCTSLTSLELWQGQVEGITNFAMMMDYVPLRTLDLTSWVGTSGTIFTSAFKSTGLVSLTIPNLIKASATTLTSMFADSSSLAVIDLSNCDLSGVSDITSAFSGCTSLTTIKGGLNGLTVSVSLSDCPITHDNAVVILNSLGTTDAQTITFSASTYSTLTDDEKAIGTSKGWSIASA